MAEILNSLKDYLGSLVGKRFDWPTCNCFVICADWVALSTGRDPAARWRNQYHDKPSALRLLRREGGSRLLARKAMLSIGCPVIETPGAGDVALVMAPIGTRDGRVLLRPTGAICVDGKAFALITVDLGLVVAPMKPVVAWSVHG